MDHIRTRLIHFRTLMSDTNEITQCQALLLAQQLQLNAFDIPHASDILAWFKHDVFAATFDSVASELVITFRGARFITLTSTAIHHHANHPYPNHYHANHPYASEETVPFEFLNYLKSATRVEVVGRIPRGHWIVFKVSLDDDTLCHPRSWSETSFYRIWPRYLLHFEAEMLMDALGIAAQEWGWTKK